MTMPDRIPSVYRFAVPRESVSVVEDGEDQGLFEMTAYTGAPVQSDFGPMIVDLGGMDSDDVLPILINHDPDQIAGLSSRVDIGQELRISGQIFEDEEAGRKAIRLSKKKFPWQASMGFKIKKTKLLERGESAEVNGREFYGPGIIATKTELFESSFVPLGRDANTAAEAFSVGGPSVLLEREESSMAEPTQAESNAASVAELEAHFSDPAFVIQQLKAGADLGQATQAWQVRQLELTRQELEQSRASQESMKSELDSCREEIARLSKRQEQGVSFTPSEQSGKSSPTSGDFRDDDELTPAELCERQWADDKALRVEFGGNLEAYKAWKRADSAGLIKVLERG